MSWCNACQRGYEPAEDSAGVVTARCPTCGREPDISVGTSTDPDPGTDSEKRHSGPPWHFWLVVVAAVLYLGWRGFEGVWWLFRGIL